MNPDHPKINDRWIFIIVYPIMALSAVHIGNDNTIHNLLRIPSYYTDLLLALGCAWGIGIYFRMLFHRIDQMYDWDDTLRNRLISHLVFGVVLPAAVILGIEAIYLAYIDIDLQDSSIFYLELPVITIYCLIINLIYLFLYHRAYTSSLARDVEKLKSDEPQQSLKENFMVQTGSLAINVPLSEVAYFVILEKHTFLVTREGKRYLYDVALEQIMKQVSSLEFFQLNRQILARRNSITLYHQTDTRRLMVELSPPQDKPAFVSKTKVLKFNAWLNKE